MKQFALIAVLFMMTSPSAVFAQGVAQDYIVQESGGPVETGDEFPPGITQDEKEFLIKRRAEDEAMRKEIEQLRMSDPQAATLMEQNYRNERLRELEEYRLEREAGLSEHRVDEREQYDVQKQEYKDPTRRQGDINDNRRSR